ncbi:MAG: sulfatase [Phycisphaerae bacterium]|nr:sulfatase [Phycisphaerae bacterium]
MTVQDEPHIPPDIIFILIDDLGWRDLACYGSTFYETPQIDQLAAQGAMLTDAYAAAPVCSPTRASLLTGKYPATLGITDWIGAHSQGRLMSVPYLDHLPRHEITIATALRHMGYRTWHVGKWHLGDRHHWPEYHGFDLNIGGCGWGHPRQGHFAPWGLPNLPEGEPGSYLADRLTDEAIGLLHTPHTRPFFLNLSYYAVHTPIQAPRDLIEKYRNKATALGLNDLPAFQDGEYFSCAHKLDQRVRRRLLQSDPIYAAMVENLDWNIGRLLQALATSPRAENTMVIFTSDNGGLATAEGSPTCNSPLAQGKGWMYEGGTRVPFIVRWPKIISPGIRCTQPISSPDIFPTLLDAAGSAANTSAKIEGISLMPMLLNQSCPDRPLFWHYPHYSNQGGTPACSIRRGDWKLIEFFETQNLELYHLRDDIAESRNVAGEHPTIRKELHDLLKAWRSNSGAVIPRPNCDWRPIRPLHLDGPEV